MDSTGRVEVLLENRNKVEDENSGHDHDNTIQMNGGDELHLMYQQRAHRILKPESDTGLLFRPNPPEDIKKLCCDLVDFLDESGSGPQKLLQKEKIKMKDTLKRENFVAASLTPRIRLNENVAINMRLANGSPLTILDQRIYAYPDPMSTTAKFIVGLWTTFSLICGWILIVFA